MKRDTRNKNQGHTCLHLFLAFLIMLTTLSLTTIMEVPMETRAARIAVKMKTKKVSTDEQKKLKTFLDKNISEYLLNCCWELHGDNTLKMNTKEFVFNEKRKTDIAIASIDLYNKLNTEVVYADEKQWSKYKPYGGMLINYSDVTAKLIKKQGKILFGDSFTLSFAENVPNGDRNQYFYPISKDKRYLVNHFTDSGEWGANWKYIGITQKNGAYKVKTKCTYGSFREESKQVFDNTFTIKLKKKGGSYIVTDIKCS